MLAYPAAPALEPVMRTATATILLLASIGITACSPPEPPNEERRPEPQAGAQADAPPRSAIVRSADAYKERAHDAAAASLEAAHRQRAALDAATR